MSSSAPLSSSTTASSSAQQPSPPNSLEEVVHALISSGRTKYDPANLTILSKYCFDFDVCRKILIKGIMNLPNVDLSQYLYLIPENKAKDPKISCIIKLNDCIQTCKFKQAWEELKEPLPNPLNEVLNTPNFAECLRKYMADIINITFVSINLNDIMGLLNFNTLQEFEKFARSHGWVVNTEEGTGGSSCSTVKGGVVIINTKTDEQSTNANVMVGSSSLNNANKQVSKHNTTSPVYTLQANASNTTSVAYTQRAVERHMSIDSIKACFATLQR